MYVLQYREIDTKIRGLEAVNKWATARAKKAQLKKLAAQVEAAAEKLEAKRDEVSVLVFICCTFCCCEEMCDARAAPRAGREASGHPVQH